MNRFCQKVSGNHGKPLGPKFTETCLFWECAGPYCPTLAFLIFLALNKSFSSSQCLLECCRLRLCAAISSLQSECCKCHISIDINQHSDHRLDRHRSNVHECFMILSYFITRLFPRTASLECPNTCFETLLEKCHYHRIGWMENQHQHIISTNKYKIRMTMKIQCKWIW